ncbi:MAG: transposase [Opitutus sp.]|nr:transposase [Opitutus sp.]
MARKLRIEFPDAVYHVINRGNYRRDLFTSAGEAGAFLSALEEAVETFGWRLHAYAIMRNHYHVALRTPQPNLGEGMHWLQTTFSTRFNRFRGERGHLFQGRYQALLVEDDAALARLVNYIHLNPVRAKIVAPEQVASFRWSSLGRFVRGPRLPTMEAEPWLRALGMTDAPGGWRDYVDYLQHLAADPAEQEQQGFATMSRGWSIGTHAWRRAVARDHSHLALQPGLGAEEARSLREARWEHRLNELLHASRHSLVDAKAGACSAPWKLEIAARLRRETGAAIAWLARTLHLGTASSARVYLCRHKERTTSN